MYGFRANKEKKRNGGGGGFFFVSPYVDKLIPLKIKVKAGFCLMVPDIRRIFAFLKYPEFCTFSKKSVQLKTSMDHLWSGTDRMQPT